MKRLGARNLFEKLRRCIFGEYGGLDQLIPETSSGDSRTL